jgi:DNA gyrase subunit A
VSNTTTPPPEEPTTGSIEPIEIQDEMERSFLEYSMSVIVSRALPDVRDGLKPVHRRILWDMEQQNFRPDRPFVKCARVSGDTSAKYHPHGDSSIYDALVRMAQPFSLRHPLVDFHGNYGSPDFGAAASRYTECRLSPLAMALLDGIDEETVEMQANYDGTLEEPKVLPARFPNLLVNGVQGIAVGMATNIPPHNLGEICDATIYLIAHPDATPDDLMEFVKGPDFPTGGLILGRAGIIEAYRTGKGSVKMRAAAGIEETAKGGLQIVVTELPYQTSCSSIASRVKELADSKELEGIRDINDESAEDFTRLVISLKRDANASVILNNLYKYTPMQTSFSCNIVALVDGVPRQLNLRDCLHYYVEHQIEVITKRSEFRRRKAAARAHVIEGLVKALNVIDEVIALIRASEDKQAAREGLMATFGFSEIQAESILDMTLARLTRLSRIDLDTELETLRKTIEELDAILESDARKREVITAELTAIRDKFAEPRKAKLTHDPGDMSTEDLIDDKELVVVMTQAGYIKTVEGAAFRTQARGGRGKAGSTLKQDDIVRHVIYSSAHAFLLFFSNRGKVYRLKAHEIPERERTAKGIPIINLLPLQPDEHIQTIIDTRSYDADRFLFFATKKGTVKKTEFHAYDSSRRDGLIAINLNDGDELVKVIETGGSDDVFMVSRKGMNIRFNENDVRPMGRAAAGVRGMKLRADDELVSCDVARDDVSILIMTDSGYGKRTQLSKFNQQGRGGQGVIGMKLTGNRGYVVAAFMVGEDDEIVAISSGGVTLRVPVAEISEQGRDATGVRIMSLDAGTVVASVAPILGSSDGEDDAE